MRRIFAWCLILVVALLGLPAFADPIPIVVFEATNGTNYALSPGVEGGSCTPIVGGMECTGAGSNSSQATSTTGCGPLYGQAFCVVVPEGWSIPGVLPLATSTLECASKNYELSVDGGSCTQNNGEDMTCSDGGVNTASATCKNGCGTTTGTGKCTVKPKPDK